MPDDILFIQTGGTIDKDYPHQKAGYAFSIGDSAAKKMMSTLDLSIKCHYISCTRKDSLDLTEEDRQKMVDALAQTMWQKVIITHGTDTLQQTGRYINDRVKNKVIILTGSMRPAAFRDSDASFNIGMAIAAAQVLDAGVYICIHGVVKEVSDIKRDSESGKFY